MKVGPINTRKTHCQPFFNGKGKHLAAVALEGCNFTETVIVTAVGFVAVIARQPKTLGHAYASSTRGRCSNESDEAFPSYGNITRGWLKTERTFKLWTKAKAAICKRCKTELSINLACSWTSVHVLPLDTCSLKLWAVSSYMPCLGSGAFGGSSSLSDSCRAANNHHEQHSHHKSRWKTWAAQWVDDPHRRLLLECLQHPCLQRLQISGTLVLNCLLFWLKQL